MASSNSRRSSISNADSGISCTTNAATVNPRYACYWSDKCHGQHELDDCQLRKSQLRGKLGIYYSSNAMFKRFKYDNENDLSLEHNPTGCTMVNLLIYKQENNEISLLFVMKQLKEKRHDHEEGIIRQPLLALPASYPCRKDEIPKQVAVRALETITDKSEITVDVRVRLKRFLFVDASVIYPLYLTNDQANLLTNDFFQNEEVTSLHWFPLSTVLNQLPEWNDYLSKQEEGKNLAQVRHPNLTGIKLNKDNLEYTMWSVTSFCLMCIRNHVGFETFLQP